MNIKIIYNGADITNELDMQSCILTDRYGGLLDSISLAINDSESVWNKYGLEKGDEIVITTDGYTTGAMYLSNARYSEGLIAIDAVSMKPSKKVIKSKIWRNINLLSLLQDCAKSSGLALKTYGIRNYTYDSLAQIAQTDLAFASQICRREGYSIKVDNKCLVVFNEKYMEEQEAGITLTPKDVSSNWSFNRSSDCIHSIKVSYFDAKKGLITQTATDKDIIGESKQVRIKVSSIEEARRFANGYLRDANKKYITGLLSMPYNANISAGTVFNAQGFAEFDGKYVVTEISHNVKLGRSSLTVRKALNY